MLKHELACDVQFAIGPNGDVVRAHKYMLVARSPVFYAMFYGSLGSGPVHDVPLVIPDTTVEAFRAMLQSVDLCIVCVCLLVHDCNDWTGDGS